MGHNSLRIIMKMTLKKDKKDKKIPRYKDKGPVRKITKAQAQAQAQ